MKKYIITPLIAVCSLFNMQAQTEMEVASTLKKVVVFPFEAQLFKTAETNIPSGTVSLRFTKLSPYIQEKSIRVSADKNLTILNVTFEKDYLAQKEIDAKAKLYQTKIKSFKEKQEELNVQLRILDDQNNYFSSNLTMSQELGTPAKYIETSNYFNGQRKENQEKTLQLNRQLSALNDSIKTYNKQIKQLTASQKEPSGTVTVLVNSKESGNAKLDLSYMVGRCGWAPAYDIRFEGITKPLSLNYKANVIQQTAFDWTDINLSLSTAETQKTADIPTLKALYLGYVYKEAPAPRADKFEEFNAFRGNEYKAPMMEPEPVAEMDEVVSVGYGSVAKKDLVASVSSVNYGDLDNGYLYNNPTEGLQGKIAGVNITQTEGSPDADMKVRVRGGASLTQSNEPLYVVDGFTVHDISDIPPSNIASIEVLKDASATAIYGARGAEGVVIITTKDKAGTSSPAIEKTDASLDGYQTAIVAARKPTTATFEVPESQTVKSENKTTLIPFKQAEVPCLFEYKAIPKLSEKVYLIARIPNWVDLDLQNGDANLYFENAFIGKTNINTRIMNDTLSVSFGSDQGISIKREKYKDFTEKIAMGAKQQQTLSWRIIIKNNKNEAVKVDVYDQVPLTNSDDTTIKALELSGGELNETTGGVHWPVSLAPGASKEIILSIEVKYPKGKRLVLK